MRRTSLDARLRVGNPPAWTVSNARFAVEYIITPGFCQKCGGVRGVYRHGHWATLTATNIWRSFLDYGDIWSIEVGDELLCKQDLVMQDDGERAFTAGRRYFVQSKHPIANPPYIELVDDQGDPHGIDGADLLRFFSRR